MPPRGRTANQGAVAATGWRLTQTQIGAPMVFESIQAAQEMHRRLAVM